MPMKAMLPQGVEEVVAAHIAPAHGSPGLRMHGCSPVQDSPVVDNEHPGWRVWGRYKEKFWGNGLGEV